MGIPSYFQYIIRSHSEIFKHINDLKQIDNAYFDSNSIVYDCLKSLDFSHDETTEEYETRLIQAVCEKIVSYLHIVKPSGVVILAFDGVAPVAKLEQQRTRRYKTWMTRSIETQLKEKYQTRNDAEEGNQHTQQIWDTSSITPGTQFMKKMDNYLHQYFNQPHIRQTQTYKKLILSGSNQHGEGEHKIFEFIRNNQEYHSKTTTSIYGLDADLIMLCLNHLYISKKLYLFRETPSFQTQLDENYEKEEICFMDIHELSYDIVEAMTHKYYRGNSSKEAYSIYTHKIQDYIFISFLLGNDFLPHFPALNIRTHGIDILMNTYKALMNDTEYLCDGSKKKIVWRQVKRFVEELAKMEQSQIQIEYKTLMKYENQQRRSKGNYEGQSQKTYEEMQKQFTYYPSLHREKEHSIQPMEQNWQTRYYKTLFHIHKVSNREKQRIAVNYLEGLEWVYEYYSKGCKNYRWKYNYHYPPLLEDLIQYIPVFDTEFVIEDKRHIDELTQLCYVLPKQSLQLLPKQVETMMKTTYKEIYREHELVWAFHKYMWESHVDMPDIDIDALEEEIKTLCIV